MSILDEVWEEAIQEMIECVACEEEFPEGEIDENGLCPECLSDEEARGELTEGIDYECAN